MWILYSVIGAFTQAAEMAIKKKALQVKGMNNFIGFSAFFFAGILLSLFLLFQSKDTFIINNVSKFWTGLLWSVVLEVIANYFLYKALDLTELSYLMPFMTFISISVIFPPIFLFGEVPNLTGILGISLVVCGAFLIDYKKRKKQVSEQDKKRIKNDRLGKTYFIITAICWTFSTPMTKLAVVASSPLLVASINNLMKGLSFVVLIYLFRESKIVKSVFQNFKKTELKYFIIAVLLAGIAIAIQIGSINTALKFAPVSYVIAIKRIMPVFAFFIGLIYFKERTNILKKLIATIIMVVGAIIVGLS